MVRAFAEGVMCSDWGGHVLAWGHVLRWGAVGPSASYAPLVVTVTVATESVLFGACCVGVFCDLGFVWVACFPTVGRCSAG